jgi:DNA helicase HerA-like ATPase
MIQIGSIRLTEKELGTHVHGIGKSRSGKSKLIELLCQQLAQQGKGFCLIDPHGSLFHDVLKRFAVTKPAKEVFLFDPSYRKRVVGFNPFTLTCKDDERIMTKTEKMVAATMRAWGVTDTTSTPRLSKWIKRLYYTLIEQDLSIADADCFFSYSQAAKRNGIIARLKNKVIQAQWRQLYEMSEKAFLAYIESTESRLEIFTHPQVRRIMGLHENCLSLRDIVNRQKILLVNLQPSSIISDENNRVLGTLLINELWQLFRERTKAYPYYLIVDECQKYLTPDVSAMLDEAAKYGLHLMLFHQREAQLDRNLSSALQNAQTKFIFSTEDDPKQQRHFTFINPDGERIDTEVPEVRTFSVGEKTLEEYKERLLAQFLTAQEVDERLHQFDESNQQEITPEKLYRRGSL